MQIRKVILFVCAFSFGFIVVPTANADVIVQYVVTDGYSHHEPMGYRPGSRLYSNGSRFQHNTYSSHNDYRNRYNAQREQHRRDHYRDYHPPRQYRNTYYSGRNHRDDRCGGSGYYRGDRKQNHRYNDNVDRRGHRSYRNNNRHEGLHHDGRVHITIK